MATSVVRFSLAIPSDIHCRMVKLASKMGLSRTALIVRMITDVLDEADDRNEEE